jgi:hypothetical protein
MSQLNVGKVNVTGDGVQYPQYTNSNRPAGTTGLVIYNTSESKLQVYTGSEWESVGADDEVVGAGVNGTPIARGNRSQRPSNDSTWNRDATIRYNTETTTHESYFDVSQSGSGGRDGWYAIGGHQMVYHMSARTGAWNSWDARWGTTYQNADYYQYKFYITTSDPNGADRYWLRYWRADNNLSTNGYYWSGKWEHSNDGRDRQNSQNNDYWPISVVNNTSYRVQATGEGGYQGDLTMSIVPNSNNMNFWSSWVNYTYWSQQECGAGWQGCMWTGPTQSGTGYPITGFRMGHQDGNSVRACNNGTNTIITVLGVAGSEAKEWSGSW